jgi:hypothetical protein
MRPELPDLLNKRLSASTHEACIIICAYVTGGVTSEQGYRIRDALNDLDTDGWWFANPGTFIVAFRSSKRGAKRARACQSALAKLPNHVPALGHVGVGSAQGEVLCDIAIEGHLDTPPLGDVVNWAFWRAAGYAS